MDLCLLTFVINHSSWNEVSEDWEIKLTDPGLRDSVNKHKLRQSVRWPSFLKQKYSTSEKVAYNTQYIMEFELTWNVQYNIYIYICT